MQSKIFLQFKFTILLILFTQKLDRSKQGAHERERGHMLLVIVNSNKTKKTTKQNDTQSTKYYSVE